MYRKLCLSVVLYALVSTAWTDVRFFFTSSASPYGIMNPANALTPSFGLGLDAASEDADGNPVTPALAVAQFPTYSTAVPTVDITKGEFVYVWMQLYSVGGYPTFPQTAPSTCLATGGVLFSATLTATGNPDKVAWYRVDNANSDGRLRWQGAATPPDYPEFAHATMQSLTAVTAYGIKNASTADPSQLWSGGANGTGRIALLGAIKPSQAGEFTIVIPLEAGTGLPLLAYRGHVSGSDYASYSVLPVFGTYHVIPEPASMLLLGLAGLLIRRR